jgi:chromate transporter
VAFVLPSFLMVLVIAALYVNYGGLPWMQGAFYGIGAAVIAIIARSVLKLARMTLAHDRLLWTICLVSALVTAWTESEIFWLFVTCGVVTVVVRAWPWRSFTAASLVLPWPTWLTIAAVPASAGVLWNILWYFTEAGLVVFGSGLAVVPFLHGGVVQQFHWLTERQFLDAVAVSMITPGPVVITVAFIGYLVAGIPGAVLAAIGIFVPCYLAVVLAAPYFHRVAGNRSVKAFVDGVTAAATGAIAGAAFVLGRRAIVDVPTLLIALVTLALLFMPKRLPEPALIVAAGIIGVVMHRTPGA